ncbi:MAG TPA: hypothetical protein VF661_07725 [Actinomycetales bacterium]|jgi:hypothetical protein
MAPTPSWLRPRNDPGTPPADGVPPTLTAALALVVAALAAVGVSGDLLTRTVRNHPGAIATVVVAALLAFGVPAIALARTWAVRLPLLVLTGAAVGGVIAGAFASARDREQPRVSVAAASTASATSLTIEASANGLRSRDDMLVQVQAVERWPDELAGSDVQRGCRTNRNQRWRPGTEPSWPGALLLWQQAGPDAKGAVQVTSKLELQPGRQEGVCVVVILLNTRGQEPRAVASFLRTPALVFPAPRG